MKIQIDKATVILGKFVEAKSAYVDNELYSQVADYKARIASKFKSIHKHQIENIQGSEFYVTLKLDGEHSHLYYDSAEADQVFLIRPRGYVYAGLPVLEDALTLLKAAGIKRCLLPGELYVKKPGDSRTRIFDVLHYTKSPKSLEDLQLLRFAPFDILNLNDEVFVDFAEVINRLQQLFGGTVIAPPAMRITKAREEVARVYDLWVKQGGAEGLMIRSDLTFRYKLKASHTIDAAIIGYTHTENLVTAVLTGLITPDGDVQVLTAVEKGFSHIERIDLYHKLKQMHMESDYMEVSRYHTPFHMVKPKLIIEFSCNDMMAERTNGMAVKKPILRLKEGTYRLQRSVPLVSLMHCVFVRFREDKNINSTDLRLAQITDFVFIDIDKEPSQDIAFPNTEIIAREVYVKESRGLVSLRKFVAWKTNKEQIDSSYTGFVFNYTDYSQGRQEPLKQDVRISSSRVQILEILTEFRKKNIKAGWKHVAIRN